MPQLNEEKKLLYQPQGLHEKYFLIEVDKQFSLFLLLSQLFLKEVEGLEKEEEIKILSYLIEGKLYLELLTLVEEVNFQILQ
jgi:hypothetical protein